MVLLMGVAVSNDELLAAAVPPPASVGADDALQVLVTLGGAVTEVVGLVDKDDVGVTDRACVKPRLAQLLLGHDGSGDGGVPKLVGPHLAEGCRADDQRLLPQVVGIVLQQLLPDPGLAQAHRVSNQDPVVAGKDPAGLLDRVLLELGQLHADLPGAASVVPRSSLKYSKRAFMYTW